MYSELGFKNSKSEIFCSGQKKNWSAAVPNLHERLRYIMGFADVASSALVAIHLHTKYAQNVQGFLV